MSPHNTHVLHERENFPLDTLRGRLWVVWGFCNCGWVSLLAVEYVKDVALVEIQRQFQEHLLLVASDERQLPPTEDGLA